MNAITWIFNEVPVMVCLFLETTPTAIFIKNKRSVAGTQRARLVLLQSEN